MKLNFKISIIIGSILSIIITGLILWFLVFSHIKPNPASAQHKDVLIDRPIVKEGPPVSAEDRLLAHYKTTHIDNVKKRLNIIITGLGLDRALTEEILEHLPPSVGVSFSVYSPFLQEWLSSCKNNGHQTFIDLPLEPYDFPDTDPGPMTLLTSEIPQNAKKLESILSYTDFDGFVGSFGGRFLSFATALEPLLRQVYTAQKWFIDPDSTLLPATLAICEKIGAACKRASVVIFKNWPARQIRNKLLNGQQTTIIIQANFQTVEKIEEWLSDFSEFLGPLYNE